MWLSVTEGDLGGRLARLPHWPDTEFIEGHGNVPLVAEEDVWRDYYTGERVEFQLPEYAYNVSGKGYNCLAAVAEEIGFTSIPFAEFDCLQRHMSCTCEYARDPVVTLRGLCPELYKERAVDSKFIPFQNLSYPRQLHWQGIRHSMLKLDASDKKRRKWRMSSSVNQVGAISNAPLLSFGLGLHEWEVSGDTWCNEGKSYKTWLKLTGCDQSTEFTCNDGQCINIEQRLE